MLITGTETLRLAAEHGWALSASAEAHSRKARP